MNRTSDEIRRRRWNWIGHIMRTDREEHCVTALEWSQEGGEDQVDQNQHGGEWLRMKDEQLGGSHG